jgi:Zn-dependent peptidase ImmA (M78 family)
MVINGNLNKKQIRALEYYAKNLFTPQLLKHIEITVKFVKFADYHHGLVTVEDYNVLGSPRSFLIEINKSDDNETKLISMAHELVHVKQYARNELNEEMSYWRGNYVNSDEIPYDQQPWEIEAETRAKELYAKFLTNEA